MVSPTRMPTVLELPLKERSLGRGEHIVGTVIGVLRATGTGALKPVPFSPATRPGLLRRRRPKTAERSPPRPATVEPYSLDHLFETRKLWRNWLAGSRAAVARGILVSEEDRWERLDASLGTLCDCLVRTHSPALRAALAAEAGAVVSAIHAQMRG
jgi:hypothetical protein